MLQIEVGYPSAQDELEIVRRTTAPSGQPVSAVLTRDEILQLQDLVRRVPVADHVIDHAVQLVRRSRPGEPGAPEVVRDFVAFGAGPRASQALILGAKARAVLDGRFAAEIEDVQALAVPTMRHRLVMNFRGEAEGVNAAMTVRELLSRLSA
jgi:MoxR-like ATPase